MEEGRKGVMREGLEDGGSKGAREEGREGGKQG